MDGIGYQTASNWRSKWLGLPFEVNDIVFTLIQCGGLGLFLLLTYLQISLGIGLNCYHEDRYWKMKGSPKRQGKYI